MSCHTHIKVGYDVESVASRHPKSTLKFKNGFYELLFFKSTVSTSV